MHASVRVRACAPGFMLWLVDCPVADVVDVLTWAPLPHLSLRAAACLYIIQPDVKSTALEWPVWDSESHPCVPPGSGKFPFDYSKQVWVCLRVSFAEETADILTLRGACAHLTAIRVYPRRSVCSSSVVRPR